MAIPLLDLANVLVDAKQQDDAVVVLDTLIAYDDTVSTVSSCLGSNLQFNNPPLCVVGSCLLQIS